MTYKYRNHVPPTAWIVVADRARARIFSTDWPRIGALREVAALVHPESSLHERDVDTDGPGKFRELGSSPLSGEPPTDFRHRTAVTFAGEVAAQLDKGRMQNQFGHLVLIAPALYLGVLREKLSSPLARMVASEIPKDYTLLKPEEIREQLNKDGAP